MDTKQPEALRIANTALQVRNKDTPDDVYVALVDCAWALRNLHAENERLRARTIYAQHEISDLHERVQQLGQAARDVNSRRVQELEAQLEAVGAGGVEPLRKRECLHQIGEPAQPVLTDAYVGAREDLAIWKKRALEAEALSRKFAASVNSPSFMGEPAALAQAGEYPELPSNLANVLRRIGRCESERAAQAAPVGMEPVYQIGQPFLFDPENTWRDASKDAYDVCMPNKRRIIYTESQVQAI